VDAIDTVTAKLHLIQTAKALGVPVISSMGTGNKLRPDLLTACDISKTTTCPLARVMRRELRARGIEHLRVVYSTEPPRTPKNRRPRTGAAPSQGYPRQQPMGALLRRAADRRRGGGEGVGESGVVNAHLHGISVYGGCAMLI